jgi:hypothetical protein
VEWVTELSYAKTCRIAGEWLGETVSPRTLHRFVQERGAAVCFTPAPVCAVALADGTRVPAGKSERGCEIRFCLQILGRDEHHGRPRVLKRIAGWSVERGRGVARSGGRASALRGFSRPLLHLWFARGRLTASLR